MSTLILCFHRVADPVHGGRSMLAISPDDFERVLDEVGSRFEFVTLEEGARPSRQQRAVVTFDDGYADNLYSAAPILQERGIPATFFIVTGFIGTDFLFPPDALDIIFSSDEMATCSSELDDLLGGGYVEALRRLAGKPESQYWRLLQELSALSRDRALESDPLRRPMTDGELRELSKQAGFLLGPHTSTHRRLSGIPLDEASVDIEECLKWFETNAYASVPFFAYPYGQQGDVTYEVSRFVSTRGLTSLTTFPLEMNDMTRRIYSIIGIPRLSVGPLEAERIALILRLLRIARHFPRGWLLALKLRRRLSLLTSNN